MEKNIFILFVASVTICLFLQTHDSFASPFFENNAFTANGIEWCEENYSLYMILGDGFFEHHKYSLESRVCASLINDELWMYDGSDRVQQLIEKSRYYTQLEITESISESKTGVINPTPASREQNMLIITETTFDGKITLKIVSEKPQKNKQVKSDLTFLDTVGKLVSDVNFDVEVYQNGKLVYAKNNMYSQNGMSSITTRPLDSSDPLELRLKISGIGNPSSPAEWSEPKDEILLVNIVPEFGTMVMLILMVGIIFMIGFSKNHFVLHLRK